MSARIEPREGLGGLLDAARGWWTRVVEKVDEAVASARGRPPAEMAAEVVNAGRAVSSEATASGVISQAEVAGALAAMQAAGIARHRWVTQGDNKVRPSHRSIHDQVVRVGDPFDNHLRYPGDQSGPLEEWAGCRCHVEPIIERQQRQAPQP